MKQQIIIADSSALDTYLTCHEMWNFSCNQNLQLTKTEEEENNSQRARRMGTLGHKWLDIYYFNRGLNKPLAECVSIANKFDPDVADIQDKHQYPLKIEDRKSIMQRLQHYWMTYSQKDYIPLVKQIPHIIVDELGLPVDTFQKKPLVEQGFSHELLRTPEYLFILEGRIDMITEMNNNPCFMDHKFQLRERALYHKSIQFKSYAMVTGLMLGIINYIRLHKEVSEKTLKREVIAFNTQELHAWREELVEIFIRIAKEQKQGKFERNWSACSGRFGYPCEFTHICEESNKKTGELIKLAKYSKKQEWKPW